MKQLKCEMCGSNNIVKEEEVFVCQSCGCKYSVEAAKKMMVEVEGTVKVEGPVEVTGNVDIQKTVSVKNDYKKECFSSFLINLISLLPWLVLIFMLYQYYTTNTEDSLTFEPKLSIAVAVFDLIIVLIGTIVYFVKAMKAKRILSVVYLILSGLGTLGLFFFGFTFIGFTCGFSFFVLTAGIMQIVAGIKYLKALKDE